MIWDTLQECLLDKIYKKIVYKQPKSLLDDIKSYVFVMDVIKSKIIPIDNILTYMIFYYEKNLNYQEKNNKYYMLKFNNAGLDYIKFKLIKMKSSDRYSIVKNCFYIE